VTLFGKINAAKGVNAVKELDYKALGQRIRQARLKMDITQEKLGELCALSTAHIGHIERGTRIASLQTMFTIATALEVSMDYLLFDSALEQKTILTAVGAMLQGKNDAQVKSFLAAVKALADRIEFF